jgi:hypothetical protein
MSSCFPSFIVRWILNFHNFSFLSKIKQIQGMSEYSGFISANRNTVKPHFIAPRFTAKLAYHQEFLQSRFSYVVITILYNKILQPWTDYFSFWIKLNKFVCVFFRIREFGGESRGNKVGFYCISVSWNKTWVFWHSLVHWCVGLDRFYCIDINKLKRLSHFPFQIQICVDLKKDWQMVLY